MIRYLIIVEGQVQGVGFRYFVICLARKYNLSGYVRNLDDGNVAMEVQGTLADFNVFFKAMLLGEHMIRIDDYHLKELNIIADEKDFKLKY